MDQITKSIDVLASLSLFSNNDKELAIVYHPKNMLFAHGNPLFLVYKENQKIYGGNIIAIDKKSQKMSLKMVFYHCHWFFFEKEVFYVMVLTRKDQEIIIEFSLSGGIVEKFSIPLSYYEIYGHIDENTPDSMIQILEFISPPHFQSNTLSPKEESSHKISIEKEVHKEYNDTENVSGECGCEECDGDNDDVNLNIPGECGSEGCNDDNDDVNIPGEYGCEGCDGDNDDVENVRGECDCEVYDSDDNDVNIPEECGCEGCDGDDDIENVLGNEEIEYEEIVKGEIYESDKKEYEREESLEEEAKWDRNYSIGEPLVAFMEDEKKENSNRKKKKKKKKSHH